MFPFNSTVHVAINILKKSLKYQLALLLKTKLSEKKKQTNKANQ